MAGTSWQEAPPEPAAASPVRRGPCSSRSSWGRGSSSSMGRSSTSPSRRSGASCRAALVGQLEGLTYVTGGYLAVLAALLIPAGALSDAYGRRRVFGFGLWRSGPRRPPAGWPRPWSCSSSSGCSRERRGRSWCPGRSRSSRPPSTGEERGRAIGTLGGGDCCPAPPCGPLVGGLLVQTLSWRAAFLVNLPLSRSPLLALRYVPESRDEEATGRVDWLGALVAIRRRRRPGLRPDAGPGARLAGPGRVRGAGDRGRRPGGLPFLMAVRPNPLVPLELFRQRTFAVVNLSTLVIYGALYVSLTFQSLFLQGTLGYTPLAAGVIGPADGHPARPALHPRGSPRRAHSARGRSWWPGRSPWPAACSGSPASRPRARPGWPCPATRGEPRAAGRLPRRRAAGQRCSSESASRCSSHP